MGYKTILVHADHSKQSEVYTEAAIHLAKQLGAHLVALYVQDPFYIPGYLLQAGQEISETQKKFAAEELARTKAVFENQASNIDFNNAEWRSTIDQPVEAVARRARYADLVVVGQRDPADESAMAKDFPAQLVLAAGRPVLILPYTGSFLNIGSRILIAWNGSREAARAITDALPLLKTADKVHLMAIYPKHSGLGDIPVDDIVQYLVRHSIQVEVSTDHVANIDVGNALLSRAADLSADLLVMGGYGHSRLREWVLGGATRLIVESMTVPVLMSH